MFAQGGSTNKYEVGLGCAPLVKYYINTFFEWRQEVGLNFDYGARASYRVGPYIQSTPSGNYQGVNNNILLLAVADYSLIPGFFLVFVLALR